MVYDLDFNQFIWNMELVDLGVVPGTRPPNCPDSFCYDIPNFGNVTALGVHAPPPMRFGPLREILDPPLHGIVVEVWV